MISICGQINLIRTSVGCTYILTTERTNTILYLASNYHIRMGSQQVAGCGCLSVGLFASLTRTTRTTLQQQHTGIQYQLFRHKFKNSIFVNKQINIHETPQPPPPYSTPLSAKEIIMKTITTCGKWKKTKATSTLAAALALTMASTIIKPRRKVP